MRSDHEMHITSFRLDQDKLARLREIAESEHRTVTQELRHLVDRRIAEFDKLEEAA